MSLKNYILDKFRLFLLKHFYISYFCLSFNPIKWTNKNETHIAVCSAVINNQMAGVRVLPACYPACVWPMMAWWSLPSTDPSGAAVMVPFLLHIDCGFCLLLLPAPDTLKSTQAFPRSTSPWGLSETPLLACLWREIHAKPFGPVFYSQL